MICSAKSTSTPYIRKSILKHDQQYGKQLQLVLTGKIMEKTACLVILKGVCPLKI
jgi:hypothetical protein